MVAYILDHSDLQIKDILQFDTFDLQEDIEYKNKSSIVISRKPNVADDDFVICKDKNKTVFEGIVQSCNNTDGEEKHTLYIMQKESLFDREIFAGNEGIINNTGIEDFIANEISANFAQSGDTFIDKTYIRATALTHTKIPAKVETENGIYNLKTYLGNAKQYYGIFLDFSFSGSALEIYVYNKDQQALNINTSVSDIDNYTENYEVIVTAKLIVKWKVPDTDTSVGPVTMRTFYLKSNRTITENGQDQDRAKGTVKSLYVEAETEEEMLQQVYDHFRGNSYNHKIELDILAESKVYPQKELYVGHTCNIKTVSGGIRETMITGMQKKNTSDTVHLKFGNLKVTLIEKIRR